MIWIGIACLIISFAVWRLVQPKYQEWKARGMDDAAVNLNIIPGILFFLGLFFLILAAF